MPPRLLQQQRHRKKDGVSDCEYRRFSCRRFSDIAFLTVDFLTVDFLTADELKFAPAVKKIEIEPAHFFCTARLFSAYTSSAFPSPIIFSAILFRDIEAYFFYDT